MRYHNIKTLLILTTLFVVLTLCGTASAENFYVNESHWQNETQTLASTTPIQSAIDNATAGDSIFVYNGDYTENIDVNKQLTLIGNGSDVVNVIANVSNDHVFYVSVNNVNISGFNVSGATSSSAGIYVTSDNCDISDNIANNNYFGIFLFSSSNNNLTNNNASDNDFGIYLGDSSDNTLTGNNASYNVHSGIDLESSSNNNNLTDNNANSNSIGIDLSDSSNNNLTSNNASDNNDYGIRLYQSSDNTLTGNNANSNDIGIYLYYSTNNNNLTSNNASDNYYGIHLYHWTNNNNLTDNNANSNDIGIYLRDSSDNNLTSNTANLNGIGIRLIGLSNNNNLTSNNASDNNNKGIELQSSSDNTLTDNTAKSNTYQDFYSLSSINNTVTDLDIGSVISFTGKNISIKSETAPPSDPSGYSNISKFINATNNSADSWLFMNVSYNETDIFGLDDSSLKMWRYNSTAPEWEKVANTNDVDVDQNYVYANITNFSIFAPFAEIEKPPLIVGPDQHYKTIQAAINAASNGDTIIVNSGTYPENVVVNKTLTLQGNDTGDGLPVVDAMQVDHAINITADGVTLDGFIATNATGLIQTGIFVISDNNVIVNNNASSNNVGIDLGGSSNNTLTDNIASSNYFGIVLIYSSNNTLTDNIANYNDYNGIYLSDSSNNTLTGNDASSNSEIGIFLDYSDNNNLTGNDVNLNYNGIVLNMSIENNLTSNIVNNNGWFGIYLINQSDFNNLIGNTANNNGHTGIKIYYSSEYNMLIDNTENSNTFQGIYQFYSDNNIFINNTANDNDRGIWIILSNNNTFTNTTANNNDYGIELEQSSHNNFTLIDPPDNLDWEVYTWDNSINNTFDIASVISVTGKDFGMKQATSPGSDPEGYRYLGGYINATNNSADSWLFINRSYSDEDVIGLNESSLKFWRYNSTAPDWEVVAGTNGVNTAQNYVYANITSFSIFAAFAEITTLYVPNDYDKIQWAIDNASDGNTIIVDSGTYYENVVVNKQLTLLGNDTGDGLPVVDAMQADHAINISADGVTLDGFIATNATYTDIEQCGIVVMSDNNVIVNNSATSNFAGIVLWDSSNNNLTDNTASSNDHGIVMFDSSNNNLTGNDASLNSDFGIFLDCSDSNNVTYNNASYNGGGILLVRGSQNNLIANNNASNNSNQGIDLSHTTTDNNQIYYNTVNGNDIGINLNFSNDNTIIGNTANNNTIDGISLYTSSNNTLTGNYANNNGCDGIYLEDSNNNTLSENYAENNSDDGINLRLSSNNTLTDNIANNNEYGIYLQSESNNNTLTGNTANMNADRGITLSSSSNNTIIDNSANYNDYGIHLELSSENNITDNTANSNDLFGIQLWGCSYNTIENNNLAENGIGIFVEANSDYNNLANNNASNNERGICFDSASDNTLTDNTAKSNQEWDFFSEDNSINNTVVNLNIGSIISFTSKDISIKSDSAPPSDPSGYDNISRYYNVTNTSADSWLFINLSYSAPEVYGLNEDSLKMWSYNSTASDWEEVTGINGVNMVDKYVYANITSFSVFAPFAEINPTIYVPTDYATIQWAIDNATDGDTIFVYNGTYKENVDIWKPLILMGEGADVTTIDGNFTDYTVRITSSNVSISGFNITNGSGINIYVATEGTVYDVEIYNNIIQSDGTTWHGIQLYDTNSVEIHDNEISVFNQGIYATNSNSITIQYNEIHDTAGGIILDSTSDSTVTDNNLTDIVLDGVYMWSSSGNTISDNNIVATGGVVPTGLVASAASADDNGFLFFVWDGQDWSEAASEQFGLQYDTRTVMLEGAAPNPDGTYTVRITHSGDNIDAAHIDYLALKKGDQEITPVSAVDVATENSILDKVSALDNDVVDVRFKTVDVTWDVSSKDKLRVVMNAREEDIDSLDTTPFSYPVNFISVLPSTYVEYVLSGDGSMVVDGELDENLGEPTFEEFYRPATGHPDGFTYYYLKNDASNLYVAVDVTVDNTEDSFGDWVQTYVLVDGTPKMFEVVGSETQWGTSGFTYTDKVNYQHKVYEFQIPLDEIGASSGDNIQIAFKFYGTAGGSDSMIYLGNSDSNTITGNDLNGNDSVNRGIKLKSSDDNTISMNTETNSSIGLEIWDSTGNSVENNQFSYNDYPGIYIQDSTGPQEVANNTVYGNLYGIYIDDFAINLIHHNILYDNGENAYDECGTGQWDDSSEGNYWDDLVLQKASMVNTGYNWINTTMEDTDWYDNTSDDNYSAKLSIPFNLVLDGVTYTDLQITSNGIIQLIPPGGTEFNNSGCSNYTSDWISGYPDETFIFAMCDDLYPGAGGWYGYTYYPAGSTDSDGNSTGDVDLVVIDYRTPTYNDIWWEGSYLDNPNDFQVVLYSNGTVFYNFKTTDLYDWSQSMESGIYLGQSSKARTLINIYDGYNAPESYRLNISKIDDNDDGIADFEYLINEGGEGPASIGEVTIQQVVISAVDNYPLVVASKAISPASASGTGTASFTVTTDVIDLANVGVNNIALWYKKDSGAWTHYGDSASGIFTFSTSSSGTYYFYTVSTDDIGKVEEVPDTDDSNTTVSVSTVTKDGGGGGGGVSGSSDPDNVNESIVLRLYLSGGNPAEYNFGNVVDSFVVTPKSTYGLVAARLEILNGKPGTISDPLNGVIYKYINIYIGTAGWADDRLSDITINFEVPASWFEENNVDPASVTLYRYHDGEWQALETTLTGQENGFYQYSVQSPGTSTFLIMGQLTEAGVTTTEDTGDEIGAVEGVDEAETATPDKGIPGFGILLGIMGILIAVYSRRK